MPEFKRVKLTESGHEVTLAADYIEQATGMTVIQKPAVDSQGIPLQPKFKESVSSAARKKTTSGGGSATSKEDS